MVNYKSKQPGYRAQLEKVRRLHNPEKVRAEAKSYYAKPENRQRRQEQQREYWHSHPEHRFNNNELHKSAYRKQKLKDPVQYLIYASRGRAKHKGLEHTIQKEDLTIPSHCPVLGIELDYYNFNRGGSMPPNAASLDRVDSTKGYIKGNVQIISWRANKLKQDVTKQEMIALYEYYIKGNIL